MSRKELFKVKKPISELQVYLTVFFVSALMISNILSNKSTTFFSQAAGVIVFPITYILSDVFSEVYGYRWSRLTCYMAFGANIFMSLMFWVSMKMPADPNWFNTEEAWANTLSVGYITAASLIAYVAGDFVNDKIFRKMKEGHEGTMKGFGFRAILSSLGGELTDSLVFMPLAFGLLPVIFNEPWMILDATTMVKRIIYSVLLKVAYEIIILPVTTWITKTVGDVEAKTRASA